MEHKKKFAEINGRINININSWKISCPVSRIHICNNYEKTQACKCPILLVPFPIQVRNTDRRIHFCQWCNIIVLPPAVSKATCFGDASTPVGACGLFTSSTVVTTTTWPAEEPSMLRLTILMAHQILQSCNIYPTKNAFISSHADTQYNNTDPIEQNRKYQLLCH